MNIETFREYMTAEILMGPNCVRILEELLDKHPLNLSDNDRVLDLGCGKGLTSFVLAKETSAKVYANDFWVSVEDNKKRFAEWGIENQVVPFCEDANALCFEKKMFQSLVSIDAYHYFATKKDFFIEKIFPFLKSKAEVLIGIPGIKVEYTGHSEELLSEWLGDEAYMFQSPSVWKEIIGNHESIDIVETWEMECFDLAWNEWFATDHKYAISDKQFFNTHIKPYTCFVGIYIKLK